MTVWTEGRKEELRQLWQLGIPKAKIARIMGTTRNAIIGASNRLNLHFKRTASRGLAHDHPAVVEGRSLFPGRVMAATEHEMIFKPGTYQRKLGARVTKGPWKDFPLYSLSLEERATCPRSCAAYQICYANSMHHAKRYRFDETLEPAMRNGLVALSRRHPSGFVVRLHLVGDFPSVEYVEFWRRTLKEVPGLRVFGYTAWPETTPIGRAVARLRNAQWDRFAIRTSGAQDGPRTLVIERAEDKPAGAIICPAQTGGTRACASCALCFAEAAKDKPIAFLRH